MQERRILDQQAAELRKLEKELSHANEEVCVGQGYGMIVLYYTLHFTINNAGGSVPPSRTNFKNLLMVQGNEDFRGGYIAKPNSAK